MYHTDDTIAAIASAPGGALRGIVRVSGPNAVAVVESCFRPSSGQDLAAARTPRAVEGAVSFVVNEKSDASRGVGGIPATAYVWPEGRSYTRQAVVEIHTIGSPPLLSAIIGTVCDQGARLAEPGEFTLRAFLAGRIDLVQAEAVIGLIDSRGTGEFERALVQLAGGLARPLHQLREALVDLLADLEAGLDFAEEDIQFIAPAQVERQIADAAEIVAAAMAQLAGRARNDLPPRAALVGWPNVGKSSLFNALSGRGAALVSNDAGTTRDYLTVTLDLGSIRCQLVDTAGVEPASRNGISRDAQQLSAAASEDCEIRILCLDASRPLNAWERHALSVNLMAGQLVVLTKCDGPLAAKACAAAGSGALRTSAATGIGLPALRSAIQDAAQRASDSESAGWAAERTGEGLRAATDALARARRLNFAAAGQELVAMEVREALNQLGRVVGTVYTDDILDRVFSRFCIGK